MHAVCVYCGSSTGTDPGYAEAAMAMGREIANRAMTLVYGGGSVGLMNATADAVLAAGGRAVGVITELLMQREVGHTGLSELHIVENMHQRKKLMADYADGFVALPGGLGTLEELFEVWTWRQLGYHNKPVGLLNVQGYYDSLLDFLAQSHEQGFVRAEVLAPLVVDTDPGRLLDRMVGSQLVRDDPWWRMREAI
ncbi:LOG family protein ORF6 in fasciation locus [mine drainage metagenome]|uniref:LOG family protein ORF6 in fasciation locus n=1 Tax=mine drainage metagenome TaxID=410659 RepID=A0A1J5RZJ1_9ZZZZ